MKRNHKNNKATLQEPPQKLKNALASFGMNGFRKKGTMLPESRKLKLKPFYRETEDDPYNTVPSLQLTGNWLRQAGFEHGKHVRVICLDKLLIICPEENWPPKEAQIKLV